MLLVGRQEEHPDCKKIQLRLDNPHVFLCLWGTRPNLELSLEKRPVKKKQKCAFGSTTEEVRCKTGQSLIISPLQWECCIRLVTSPELTHHRIICVPSEWLLTILKQTGIRLAERSTQMNLALASRCIIRPSAAQPWSQLSMASSTEPFEMVTSCTDSYVLSGACYRIMTTLPSSTN